MDLLRDNIKVITHIAIWVLAIHLIFNWAGLLDSVMGLLEGEYFDEALFMIPSLIILFYTNLNYLIPRYLKGRTWFIYVLSLIALSAVLIAINLLVFYLIESVPMETGFHDLQEVLDQSVYMYLPVIGISTAIGFSNIASKKEMQKREAIDKQKIAELKFLTTQVSPHFLFNSLNSIYALAQEEDADLTSDAILKLSHMMRYPFSDGMKERVSISQEIEFIENYLALQRTKLGEDYPIDFNTHIQDANLQVAPLLMIPIIENAFKYGISRSNPQAIIIDIESNNEQLSLKVQNPITQNEGVVSHQVGLDNLRERLEILYPDMHTFSTSDKDGTFEAELILQK